MPDKSRTPVIVGAARTPIGKFLGALSSLSAPELGAIAIREALKRSKVPAEDVNEVIMGHVIQGGTGQAPARQAALDFEQKVDETLLALIDALRTSTQVPHNLPDLRAAHNLIENRYGLVGVETDRIVTSLNTLREQIAKLLLS